ncbi:MAG: hypothetical protein ABI282_05540 [Candidatus Baltobacteraceae bacterium]
MKLACTSDACAHLFESGELTQLEFLDFCAHESACESVVLDVRHFPRTDGDYLAQVKKMAVDLGLAIAAVADDGFLVREDDAMEMHLGLAVATGAPILVSKVATETTMSWSEALERINHATGLAKASNVTLAVRNASGTFAATELDYKRVSKEADSAWLRYAMDPAELDSASSPEALVPKAVALCAGLDRSESDAQAFLRRFDGFNGPLVLGGALLTRREIQSATRRWRTALAMVQLNRT